MEALDERNEGEERGGETAAGLRMLALASVSFR